MVECTPLNLSNYQHIRMHMHTNACTNTQNTCTCRVRIIAHLIGEECFIALKASFLATGLTIRVHGNARRLPKHALNLDEVENLVTFLSNYAKENAILSGQIPGYKRDNLQLLPSNTKKVSV